MGKLMAVVTAIPPDAANVAIAPSIIKKRNPPPSPIIKVLSPVSCLPVLCIRGTATSSKIHAAKGLVNLCACQNVYANLGLDPEFPLC